MSFEVILHGVKCSSANAPTPEQIKSQIQNLLGWFCQSPFYQSSDYNSFLNALPLHTIGGFGLNTLCTEARIDNKSILINAGSGIHSALKSIANQKELHLVFTSTNLNNFLGLSHLKLTQDKVYIYSSIKSFDEHFIKIYNSLDPANDYSDLKNKIQFIHLNHNEKTNINGFDIVTYPFGSNLQDFGLLISSGGQKFAQHIRSIQTTKQNKTSSQALDLFQHADVMLHDGIGVLDTETQSEEMPEALKAAVQHNVKRIVFTQTDSAADDDEISNRFLTSFDKLIAFLDKNKANKISLDCSVAVEGTILKLT